ncbi:MAG: hypothetical protein ACI30I_00090, partial [Parabacteroides sp.]
RMGPGEDGRGVKEWNCFLNHCYKRMKIFAALQIFLSGDNTAYVVQRLCKWRKTKGVKSCLQLITPL